MATTYYCAKCNQSFTGVDPISFAEDGISQPVFPICPKARAEAKHEMTMEQLEKLTVAEFASSAWLDEIKRLRKEHLVSLGKPPPALKGSWAKPGGNLTKQESPQEKALREEREREQKQLAEQQEAVRLDLDAQQKARELIQFIDNWINNGQYKMVQARPKDYIYPPNDQDIRKATALVIHHATNIWQARGNPGNHHVLTGPKDDWRNGRVEADFMRTNDRGGKHIAHVILKD